MNILHIIGNLVQNPESRVVDGRNGPHTVCNFTVACNRHVGGEKRTEYFRVTVWNKMAENAMKYLSKGSKVFVGGPVTASAYMGRDNKPHCSLEIQDVREMEYLSGRTSEDAQRNPPADGGYIPVEVDDAELPF